MTTLPIFARRLCDDAAIFPPGLLPLPQALAAHRNHQRAGYADLVGPLVVAADTLSELRNLLPMNPPAEDRLALAVTLPGGPSQISAVLAAAHRMPVDLRALEVAVPDDQTPRDLLTALKSLIAHAPTVEVYVEVPRDERRPDILANLSGTPYRAKFRTGGTRADLHPDEAELATALIAAAQTDVPFKATAGMHHAVRNTDPHTRFHQHGFLNVLLATDAARRGAPHEEVAALLAQRDPAAVARQVAALGDNRAGAARATFVSFGTCSITEPLSELIDLGLLSPSLAGASGGIA